MKFTPVIESFCEVLKEMMRGQLPHSKPRPAPPIEVPTLPNLRRLLPRRGAVLLLQQARRNFADELRQTHPHLNRAQRRGYARQIAFA